MAEGVKLKEIFEVEKQYNKFYTGGQVLWTKDGNYFLCKDENKINVLSVSNLEVDRCLGINTEAEAEDIIYTFALDVHQKDLVTANRSGLLKLWDFESGELKKSWKSLHQGPISCIEFETETNLLATGGSDSSVKLWNYQTQVCKGTLRGVQGVLSVIRYHPNSKLNVILGSADDANIVAWDHETRQPVKNFSGHISRITGISFAADKNTFISSSRDKVIILWDYEKSVQIRTIPVYEAVEACSVLPYGITLPNGVQLTDKSKVYIASAGEEGIVKVWQANESKLLYKQENSLISRAAEDGGLAITQMLLNQSQLALVSVDHNILVHDISTFECKKQLIGFTDEILDLMLMGKKNEFLVMATNSNDIKIYQLSTMNSKILKGHTDIVLALASFKNLLLSSGKDNSVRLWQVDFENFAISLVGIGVKHTSAVGSIDFSKIAGNFFVSVSQDQCLKLWKLPKKVEVPTTPDNLNCINTVMAHEKDINCVTISPNDRFIATSSQDKTAKLWDANSLALLGVFRGHRRGVWSIKFSPVDQIVVTCAADCTIRLWNINDFSCLKTFEGHDSSVLRTEFLTNGMQLISAGADGLLKLWNIKTSECVQTMDKHEARIWTIAVTSDESHFFTGGSDSLLIKWRDVTEEKKLEEIQKKQEEILQEQELNNLLKQKKVLKALRLALNLDRPLMTLKIINSVIKDQEAGLDETVQNLSDDHKQSLLNHAVNWNTNSRNCRPAQLVLQILLQEILLAKFQVAGLGKMLEETIPYTDRHLKRMTEYLKDLKFIEYTVKCMQPYSEAK